LPFGQFYRRLRHRLNAEEDGDLGSIVVALAVAEIDSEAAPFVLNLDRAIRVDLLSGPKFAAAEYKAQGPDNRRVIVAVPLPGKLTGKVGNRELAALKGG
jgi:hypothetical protein